MKNYRARYEVILAGSGGQGLIVSGIMLGEAAILEGKNVAQTQSYGISSRGGFSKAEVVIDQDEIIYQQVQKPDMILALTEEAMEIYRDLPPSGIPVFYDTTLITPRAGENLYGYPFTEMAAALGQPGTANMIALGVMSSVTGIVSLDSLNLVVKKRFKGKALEMNLDALQQGAGLVAGQ